MLKRKQGFLVPVILTGLLALAGCGGGSGSSSPATATTLSGTAAVGFPVVSGAINVSCAAGSALSTTTNITGDWQVTISGQTLPCAVQVAGGVINGIANSTSYHSITTAFGTVNVTPLTDLLVANLAGVATPGTWFTGLNTTTLTAINQNQIDAALTQLRTALGLTPLNTINPITTAFTATSGNTSDDMLAALKTAMTSASVSYATLLSNASGTTFTVPVGFSAALTTAYAGTASGSSGGGGAVVGTLMGGAIQGNPLSLTTSVTTFAGTALSPGSTDGTGTAARFDYPSAITTDGTNLFVTDSNRQTIRKIVISTDTVTTIAGAGTIGSTDGTGTAARFNYPTGITTDGTNLFVADLSNSTIRKIH